MTPAQYGIAVITIMLSLSCGRPDSESPPPKQPPADIALPDRENRSPALPPSQPDPSTPPTPTKGPAFIVALDRGEASIATPAGRLDFVTITDPFPGSTSPIFTPYYNVTNQGDKILVLYSCLDLFTVDKLCATATPNRMKYLYPKQTVLGYMETSYRVAFVIVPDDLVKEFESVRDFIQPPFELVYKLLDRFRIRYKPVEDLPRSGGR